MVESLHGMSKDTNRLAHSRAWMLFIVLYVQRLSRALPKSSTDRASNGMDRRAPHFNITTMMQVTKLEAHRGALLALIVEPEWPRPTFAFTRLRKLPIHYEILTGWTLENSECRSTAFATRSQSWLSRWDCGYCTRLTSQLGYVIPVWFQR